MFKVRSANQKTNTEFKSLVMNFSPVLLVGLSYLVETRDLGYE